MATIREQALDALHAALETVPGTTARRGGEFPTAVPVGGLLTLRDGDPGDPEVTLSPARWHYEHRAEVEIVVQPVDPKDGPDEIDSLIERLGVVLALDRTLGGVIEWLEPVSPITEDLATDGAPGIFGAIVPVILTYTTPWPLA